MAVDEDLLDQIALTQSEYDMIVRRLGREPTNVELGMFGALWSEHCAYKHSRPLLKHFPSTAPWVLLQAGEENAGAVDIGDGLAVVFKMESHNHPSAIEPFHGAATGVGGIVRDILALGARPIALLNSLRFGPLDDPRNRYLFNGVVSGISWYGNCIGVPDVGGEIRFANSYSQNPLVNAMCVGLVKSDSIIKASTGRPGDLLLLVGSETGRDGIHGASGLASRTFETEREMRPTVQVADPFTGKRLIEACLQAAATGCLSGMQDLGAAGLTSAIVESASKSGAGFQLDLDLVPQRERAMAPYEIMLSESQERMLFLADPSHREQLQALCHEWDLPCTEIGRITKVEEALVIKDAQPVANLPVLLLTDPPSYRTKGAKKGAASSPLAARPASRMTPNEALLALLASPDIASKASVYRQYDHQVQTNTVLSPGGDAALLRIKGTNKGLALCADGNGRYCQVDPYVGGSIAVAEACRNLSCVGARPLAITNCLNFGNPERPDIYRQLEWCIRGMAQACRVLNVPVVSGNVSLYNETRGEPVYPTPVVGALGLLEDVVRHASHEFKDEDHAVVLLGAGRVIAKESTLAGSEYARLMGWDASGKPRIDLTLESRVQSLTRTAIDKGLVSSAHDCSDGGLAIALAECCIPRRVGFQGSFKLPADWEASLFGEQQSRIVVSLKPNQLQQLRMMAAQERVPMTLLGETGGDRFTVGTTINVALADINDAWTNGLERALAGTTR